MNLIPKERRRETNRTAGLSSMLGRYPAISSNSLLAPLIGDFLNSPTQRGYSHQVPTLSSIQILRGVAAWLVVFHHYVQMFDIKSDFGLTWFLRNKGGFGVDIFFVISGLIMYVTILKSNRGPYDFLVRRIIRIVPAYYSYTVLFLAIGLGTTEGIFKAIDTDWTLKSIFLSLLFFPSQNPSGVGLFPFLTVGWTLNYEMYFYGCLAVALLVFRRHSILACAGLIVALSLLPAHEAPVIWRYQYILNNQIVYEFLAGMATGYFFINKSLPFKHPKLTGTVLIIIGLICVGIIDTSRQMSFPATLYPATMIVAGGLMLEQGLDSKEHYTARFAKMLGNISYSTYLIHLIVIAGMKQLFMPESAVEEVLLLVFLIIIVLSASWISFHTIEKMSARYLHDCLLSRGSTARNSR